MKITSNNCLSKNSLLTFIILLIVSCFISNTYAQLTSLQTKYLHLIYYDEEHSYITPHLARCFENSLKSYRLLFKYEPTEEVIILLHDFGDYGHGGTSTLPWNYISIGIEPFDYVYDTQPANERMNWLMNHELVHIVATDQASSSDNFFRKIFFGKVDPVDEQPVSMFYSYLTSPRWYSPRWYHEGIAVFLEKRVGTRIKRPGIYHDGVDSMIFRQVTYCFQQ